MRACVLIALIVVGYEKRDLIAHFPNLHIQTLISETIAAMNFKLGMNILPSCHTRYVFRALPMSSVGGASTRVHHVRKSLFYASLWWLTAQDRRLAVAFNVGSMK